MEEIEKRQKRGGGEGGRVGVRGVLLHIVLFSFFSSVSLRPSARSVATAASGERKQVPAAGGELTGV